MIGFLIGLAIGVVVGGIAVWKYKDKVIASLREELQKAANGLS